MVGVLDSRESKVSIEKVERRRLVAPLFVIYLGLKLLIAYWKLMSPSSAGGAILARKFGTVAKSKT